MKISKLVEKIVDYTHSTSRMCVHSIFMFIRLRPHWQIAGKILENADFTFSWIITWAIKEDLNFFIHLQIFNCANLIDITDFVQESEKYSFVKIAKLYKEIVSSKEENEDIRLLALNVIDDMNNIEVDFLNMW